MTDPQSEYRFMEQCHAYLDGELSPREKERFLAFVVSHPEFQTTFERLQTVHHQLRTLLQTDPPAGLEARILKAVQQEAGTGQRSPNKSLHLPLNIAASILILALAGLTLPWASHKPDHSPAPTLTQHKMETLQPDSKTKTVAEPITPPSSRTVSEHLVVMEDTQLAEEMEAVWMNLHEIDQAMVAMEEGTQWLE